MIINKTIETENFTDKSIKYNLNEFLVKVYKYISISLIISMFSALFLSTSNKLIFVINNFRIIFFLVPIVIIYYMSRNIALLSKKKTIILFFLFSTSVGISISYIFLLFTGESITSIFLTTACTFILMSYYSNKVKNKSPRLEKILSICVIVIIITTIINILFKSSGINIMNNILGTIVFSIFIAYDTNRIKNIYLKQEQKDREKLAIYSAIILYINFINLFVHMLQILGVIKNRDSNII